MYLNSKSYCADYSVLCRLSTNNLCTDLCIPYILMYIVLTIDNNFIIKFVFIFNSNTVRNYSDCLDFVLH